MTYYANKTKQTNIKHATHSKLIFCFLLLFTLSNQAFATADWDCHLLDRYFSCDLLTALAPQTTSSQRLVEVSADQAGTTAVIDATVIDETTIDPLFANNQSSLTTQVTEVTDRIFIHGFED